jgi:RNA polymerase sigma-70 factor (ECF subfamily)
MPACPAVATEDSELAVRAARDPAAFATLYDRYFSRIYNFVCYRVRDIDAADDLVTQIFERVLAGIEKYRPERGSFSGWIFTIARNEVHSYFRIRKRRTWLSLDNLRQQPAGDPSPEDVVVWNELTADLLAALDSLDERAQDLIAFKFGAGLTNRRIAELTGLSESNVGVILYRTIRRLRKVLQSEDQE